MTEPDNEVGRLGHGLAWVSVFGGAIAFAGVMDLARYLFGWHSPISTFELLLIMFTGMAIGGIAFLLVLRARRRHTPTPNNRWRGP